MLYWLYLSTLLPKFQMFISDKKVLIQFKANILKDGQILVKWLNESLVWTDVDFHKASYGFSNKYGEQ